MICYCYYVLMAHEFLKSNYFKQYATQHTHYYMTWIFSVQSHYVHFFLCYQSDEFVIIHTIKMIIFLSLCLTFASLRIYIFPKEEKQSIKPVRRINLFFEHEIRRNMTKIKHSKILSLHFFIFGSYCNN